MLKDEYARAAKRAQEMDATRFLTAILKERADLRLKVESGAVKPVFPGLGYSAYTIIIGNEVFKTAQYHSTTRGVDTKDQILGIARERDLLIHLSGRGLLTPKVTHEGRDFLFFGMELLPGDVLTRQDVEQMAAGDRLKLARCIAGFCARLSQEIPEAVAKNIGLDTSPAEKIFDGETLLTRLSDPHIHATLNRRYDFFRNAIEHHIGCRKRQPKMNAPQVMHCDLKEGNILWDTKTKEITGFIDFGLSHLTGVESGFKKLYEKFPADFVDLALKEYCSLTNMQVTRQDIQAWACAEYVAYAIDEITKGENPKNLPAYEAYVKPALQIAPDTAESDRVDRSKKTPTPKQ